MSSNMYLRTKTWNPFKGCEFDCSYCVPSFQQQAKRQKHRCDKCYQYVPHEHPERLGQIPTAEIVFVCGNGDISFCDPGYTRQIINSIRTRTGRKPGQTFYLQSKRPEYFAQFVADLPESVVLVATLETNRDDGYEAVSKAAVPTERYRQFKDLDYARKVVTIEPVMDFDVDVFSRWVIDLDPEYVWLGYNSRPKQVSLPEQSPDKVKQFAGKLKSAGAKVKGKTLRGIVI